MRQEQERVAQMERRAEVWSDAETDALALANRHAEVAQNALAAQNVAEDALTRTQQKLKRADGTRSLLKKRNELVRMQEAIHRLQAMDMVPVPAPEEPEEKEEYEDEEYEDEDEDDDEEEDEDEVDEEEYENSDDPVRPRPLPRLAPQLGSRHWRLGTLPHRAVRVRCAPALFAGGRPSGDADGEAAGAPAHAPRHLRAAPAA